MENIKLGLEKIRAIETQTTDELKQSMSGKNSPENAARAFRDAVVKLNDQMDLYYLEMKGSTAIVKKRSDNSVVFMTDGAREVEILKGIGAEGQSS